MKPTILTILILLTLPGFSQFLNLDWPKQNVKAQNRNLELIYHCPDYLEYKTPSGWIAYEFTGRFCTAAFACMDSLAGVRLIESHEYKNWQPTAPNQWDYHTGNYTTPVKVSADWYGGNVVFKYWL